MAALAAFTSMLALTAAPVRAAMAVNATVETTPVHTSVDSADDTVTWIHPSKPELSTVIGTDNKGWGLAVYDLAGKEIFYDASVRPNNVDLRYNFPLGGDRVPLVAFSNVPDGSIGVYTVDPQTRGVVDVAARKLPGLQQQSAVPSGFCLYRSAVSGKYYGFVVNLHAVEQWELFDGGQGRVDGMLVRTLPLNTDEAEGCVADDRHGHLYVADENVGIWRYAAEPDADATRALVASTGTGGRLTADVEGLTIYATADGGGYLLASSQHASRIDVFSRTTTAYVGGFQVAEGAATDKVTTSDGIDVTNFPLGPAFPQGLFVVQDDVNTGGNQNFKYVPWGSISQAFAQPLRVDTTFDPRTVGGGAGGNRPPFVAAGKDQTITPTDGALLSGAVEDDGLPGGAVDARWTVAQAPAGANVTFAQATSPSTSATFSAPGLYRLRLSATDGELRYSDTVTVTVTEIATVQSRVAPSDADAEENTSSGAVLLTGTDLELGVDGTIPQAVGLRFPSLEVPTGATITGAHLQLKADEVSTGAAELTIAAQAADSADAFTAVPFAVSSRPRTAAAVAWAPPDWPTAGAAGAAQRTPDLAAVVQQVVDRPGWQAGNALALIVTGTGRRTAESFEGDWRGAPLLQVSYRVPRSNAAPTVDAGIDSSVTLPDAAALDGTVADDGLPSGTLATRWETVSAPAGGTVAFADASAVDTTATFTSAGTYVLRLRAEDGLLAAEDTVTVNVASQNGAPWVDAGPDRSVTLPAAASLDGTVTDDGLPSGVITTTWDTVSAPAGGTVTFGDASAVDTTASFSSAGTYVLRLRASDGASSTEDTMTATVVKPTVALNIRIGVGSDDAEELGDGRIDRTSTDLELVYDRDANQTVGMRFPAVKVPPGARITNAWVQFQTDEATTATTNVVIKAHAVNSAPTFSTTSKSISSRPRTIAGVSWQPAGWPTVGQASTAQRTPNLAPVIQEIVNRTGWASGNAIALIVTGSGRRTAESFEGSAAGAPLLRIEYQ